MSHREQLTEDDDTHPVHCQNCEWTGPANKTEAVSDLSQRVEVGEPMPTGECPECGALCQYDDESRADLVTSEDVGDDEEE